MIYKLLLLLIIVIILVITSFLFVTNEGFQTKTSSSGKDSCKLDKIGLNGGENCSYDECYDHTTVDNCQSDKMINSCELKTDKDSCNNTDGCIYYQDKETKTKGECKTKCRWDQGDKICRNNSCQAYTDEEECNKNSNCKYNSDTDKCEVKDSNCNKIIPLPKENVTNLQNSNGREDSYLPQNSIHTVCPYNPKCLGICLNDFVWTKENIEDLKQGSSSIPEEALPQPNTLKNKDAKHLIVSSRCMECVKNFYTIGKLLKDNKCANLGKGGTR